MAFVLVTDAATGIGVGSATFNGHWTGAIDPPVTAKFLWGYSALDTETAPVDYGGAAGSHAQAIAPTNDRIVFFEVRAHQYGDGFQGGGQLSFKSYAALMTFDAPTVVAVRDTEADVRIVFNPNTFESTAEVKVQYKLASEPTVWTDGSTITGLYGTGDQALNYTITGLLANTLYDFRFVASRNTANATSLTSAVGQFTTAAAAPSGARIIWLG